jgi:hypothetical protein
MTLIDFTIKTKSQRKIYGIIAAVTTICSVTFVVIYHGNHLETDQSLCPSR